LPRASISFSPARPSQFVAQHGAAWETELANVVPDIAAAKMSPFELGIQAFRERALLGYGGIN
jgi:hypothetical protein